MLVVRATFLPQLQDAVLNLRAELAQHNLSVHRAAPAKLLVVLLLVPHFDFGFL